MSLEGQQIDRYRILRLLGSGGMGEVYLAEDARIEQQIAIKVIRAESSAYPDAQASQDAARLFQREARAIAKLDHPHILPLYAYGEERLGNMTVIYLVMPYRKEGSLSDWLRQRGQAGLLSPQEIARIVRQAASALQHAHEHHIVHQDVKPSNFLIRHRPEKPMRPDLLLADFGVARFSTATASASLTIRGTPTYMAPEQWEGHPVPATDQYALAVMAYELLVGRPPFQGAPGPLMYQHLMAPVPPPRSLNPRLSRDLDAVLLHALAKKPQERFASMTAFATAFQQAVQAQAPQEADAPTSPSAAPTPASQGDIRAVLAISTTEARTGTTRRLTLPGGRQVTVSVPAGVQDGQLVRLDGQGEPFSVGGPSGALILSILVQSAEEPSLLAPASTAVAEDTVLTANSAPPATSAPTVSNTGQLPTASNPARPEMSTPSSLTASSMEIPPGTHAEQPMGVSPVERPLALPAPVTVLPPQRGISRRTILVGLGLTGLAVAGGGITWWILTPHLGSIPYTYRGHSDWVNAVAWSPDGKRIASASDDGTVQVWNATDGGNVFTYRGHSSSSRVLSVAWSPDGKRIASGSNAETVRVWDAADGRNVYTYTGQAGAATTVAWSPDGKRVASGGWDNTVQVWDAVDGGHVFTYREHSNIVNAVAWSPDGKRISSASDDGTVQVWNATDGGNVFTYRGYLSLSRVFSVAWSPNGERIASASDDRTVQVWNAADGGNVFTYRGHSNSVYTVAWSPDGKRIASGSWDKTVQVWNATDGGNVFTYGGHSNGVDAVAWSPDGKRIASGSEDKTVQVWVAE